MLLTTGAGSRVLTFVGRVVGVRRAESFGGELHDLHFVLQHVGVRVSTPFIETLITNTKTGENATQNLDRITYSTKLP